MGAAPRDILSVVISLSLVMAAGLTFPPREPFRWRTRDGAKQKITPVSPLGSPLGDPKAARGERVTYIHTYIHTYNAHTGEAKPIGECNRGADSGVVACTWFRS